MFVPARRFEQEPETTVTTRRSLRIDSARTRVYDHQLDHDADNDRLSRCDAARRTARRVTAAARHSLTH